MAGVIIPPWLDVKPSEFAQSEEAGMHVGADVRGQNIADQEAAARIQQQGNEAATQAQVERERIASTSAIAKARLDIEAQAAARKYQAQQAYQSDIAGGMDPVQALTIHAPLMGRSLAGLGTLGAAQFAQKQAMIPPSIIRDEDGRALGVFHAGKFSPTARPATVPNGSNLSAKDKMYVQSLQRQIVAGDDKANAPILAEIQRVLGQSDDDGSDMPTTQAQPNQAQINRLIANPGMANYFDLKFGEGASKRVLSQMKSAPAESDQQEPETPEDQIPSGWLS